MKGMIVVGNRRGAGPEQNGLHVALCLLLKLLQSHHGVLDVPELFLAAIAARAVGTGIMGGVSRGTGMAVAVHVVAGM